jgi:hypothetical protein
LVDVDRAGLREEQPEAVVGLVPDLDGIEILRRGGCREECD